MLLPLIAISQRDPELFVILLLLWLLCKVGQLCYLHLMRKPYTFCIFALISNTFFEGSKYALPNLLFRKTSLIYTWSSFSLSPAGKSLEFTWHISVSHAFPLIANINVFQLWALQLGSHLWKPSSASLLYSSWDQRAADLPLVSLPSRSSQSPAQRSSLWFDRTDQLINSILIPNTLQQALFPNIFPLPRTSSATLDSVAPPARLCAPAGWGLGKCGRTLPLRGCCVTRHLKGPENGTCHASVTASPA